MEIKHLQQIILANRNALASLYEDQQLFKSLKRDFDDSGDTHLEYRYHEFLKATKAQVKKLVELQKALKAELKRNVAEGRVKAAGAEAVSNGKALADEIYE